MGTVSGTLLFSQTLKSLMEDPSTCQSSLQTHILTERWKEISGKGGKQQKRDKKKIFNYCKYVCLHKLNYNVYVLDYTLHFIPHLRALGAGSQLKQMKEIIGS